MNSRHISPPEDSTDCLVDCAALAPRLLPGETTQGFLTASYIERQPYYEAFDELTLSGVSLRSLLYASKPFMRPTLMFFIERTMPSFYRKSLKRALYKL